MYSYPRSLELRVEIGVRVVKRIDFFLSMSLSFEPHTREATSNVARTPSTDGLTGRERGLLNRCVPAVSVFTFGA